jgi:hypothetical protein
MPTTNEELLEACKIAGTDFNLQKVRDLLAFSGRRYKYSRL